MTTQDRPMYIPDPAGWKWMQLLLDHNPCFLLSALFMFVGVFLLNAARDPAAADMTRLLGVLAAVNVYEFAMLGLALVLLRRMGIEKSNRDPFLLLFIAVLFLTDGGFLINEGVQTSPNWGITVNVALFVLAVIKATLVMTALQIPKTARTLDFLVVQLAILYGMPILLSKVAVGGEVSERAMYWTWWLVGLLPLAYDLIAGQRVLALTQRQQFLRRTYIIVPWLMLIAHLGFYHYVYEAPFTLANLPPILIGLAVATRRLRPTFLLPEPQLMIVRLALPAIALLFSLAGAHHVLSLPTFGHEPWQISGTWVTLNAVVILYSYFFALEAAFYATIAVMLVNVGRIIWPAVMTSAEWTATRSTKGVEHAFNLLPRTTTGWGIMAITAAFLLLAIGALASLRRTRTPPPAV